MPDPTRPSFLGPYLRQRRRRLALLGVLATGGAVAQTGGWLLVGAAIDQGIVPGDSGRLGVLVLVYLGAALVQWWCAAALIRGLAAIGQDVVLELRRRLFDHLTRLSPGYFSGQRGGWVISRMTSDMDTISDAISEALPKLLPNVVLLPAALAALFVADWRLALAALVVVPPAVALVRWYRRRSSVAQLTVRDRIAEVTAHLAESIAGISIVQTYRLERRTHETFRELNQRNREANVVAQRLLAIFFPSVELLGVIAAAAVLLVGASVIPPEQIGTLTAAYFLVQLIVQPLQHLSDAYGRWQAAVAATVKIGGLLEVRPEVTDVAAPTSLGRLRGEIELERVVFGYEREPVLHGIDLRVPAGGCLAIVGRTGGGKSTITKLVGRFYDPWRGVVRVDGVDLRQVELRGYRRQLGVVPQRPFLFAGTIADNLRFARPEASDAELAAAAAAIGLDRVARRFQSGLEHPVSEAGSGLSSGERQLISIGRALLADPRVLILDEATSNIDRPTEALIEQALDRLLRGRTSLIVAHRLSTVRRADRVVVVDRGRIVQRGSHRDLSASEGPFRRLSRL